MKIATSIVRRVYAVPWFMCWWRVEQLPEVFSSMLRPFMTIDVANIQNRSTRRQLALNQAVPSRTYRSPVDENNVPTYCIAEITNEAKVFVREPFLRLPTQHTVGASAGGGVQVGKGRPDEGFERGIYKQRRGKFGLCRYLPRMSTSACRDDRLSRDNTKCSLTCIYAYVPRSEVCDCFFVLSCYVRNGNPFHGQTISHKRSIHTVIRQNPIKILKLCLYATALDNVTRLNSQSAVFTWFSVLYVWSVSAFELSYEALRSIGF